MTEEKNRKGRDSGTLVGIGAAIGAAIDDLGTWVWIGAVIGVGLGLLASFLYKT